MTDAEQLNTLLRTHYPAAARCMSPLGLRAAFPRGIPYQSAEAKSASLNATIGQVTNGNGDALPPRALAALAGDLDPRMSFLYSPMAGHASLRTAWRVRQSRLAGLDPSTAPVGLPMVTHGLTQAVSLVAALFSGPQSTVILPSPRWENYDLIFGWHGSKLASYPFFSEDGRFNTDGLARTLARYSEGPVVVVINLPGNPTGFTPAAQDARDIARVLLDHPGPAIALFDDAYQGTVWEPDLLEHSLYWEVASQADRDRLLPIKVDGATKELLFFPGRVGFLSSPASGPAADALLSKLMCVGRATVGSPPGPSQAMVLAALRAPTLDADIAQRLNTMKGRYLALREAFRSPEGRQLQPKPFNSGYFALIELPAQLGNEAMRRRLLDEVSVGTIALPNSQALRVAYCSVEATDLPELVTRIARTVRG